MQYSVVDYQSIVDASHSLRFDAEFFRPDYLQVQRRLEAIGSRKLIDLQANIRHPKEIKRNYVDDGVLFLRAQNVRPLSIDLTANPVYISEEDAERLKENTIHHKDILITRSGANAGQCAIYLENSYAISSSHTFILKSGNLNPFFLTIFLNSRYGKTLIERGKYGSSQPEIAPPFLYQIPVPNWKDLQTEIEKIYLRSKELTELSKTRYAETQPFLLSELGLADWQPKYTLAFTTDYASMQRAERIDADYFQPKYDDIISAIKSYPGGWGTIASQVHLKDSNFKPEPETEYRYIELADIGSSGEIKDCMIKQGQALPSRARCKVNTGNVIASSVEGSLESIALVTDEYDNALCSTGFHAINSDVLNSETLLVLLKSSVGQLQLKKGCSGTILTAINREEFGRIVIPFITADKQSEIQQKVIESFNLRKRAKDLLECAKQAVEIAIKQDEQTAIEWLESVS
ncbi:MAG: restriction endonuclease subunit S [Candidatus Poribacteria bacterium]|nr:restriction endonuclease subunit S [Candidatus Poribacteria bacterium]